jgi:predicted trehalose synthase
MDENSQTLLMNQKLEELEDRLRSIAVSDIGELQRELETLRAQVQTHHRILLRINSWLKPVTPRFFRAWLAR